MKTLFVVYILMNGIWMPGDMIDGWGSITYKTEEICMERKLDAEAAQRRIKLVNANAFDKRFECVLLKNSGTIK